MRTKERFRHPPRPSGRSAGVSLSPLVSVPLSFLAPALVMGLAWGRQRRTRDASLVDLVWTLAVGATALFHALTAGGHAERRALVAVLVLVWSLRLGVHLARRLAHSTEDGRYAALRARLGARADAWFFVFFQGQAALVGTLGLAFLVLCRSEREGWRASDALALVVFVLALAGEARADRELAQWRADPAHRGRTCRLGLWRYSRHPNYFFEWLHWLTYPLLGLGLEHGAWLWLAPLGMYLLVRHVTGVPPAEEQALRSRGDDYRRYQATTNAFFPGPPRAAQGA